MRRLSFIITIVFISLFLSFHIVSAEVSENVLGQVAISGKAEIKVSPEKWVRINNIYPVYEGAAFRTTDGTLSFLFKDGTRVEAGDNTEIVISGIKGRYEVEVLKGKISFSVPSKTHMLIQSAGLQAEINRSEKLLYKVTTESVYTIGALINDGKRAKVLTFAGQIMVKTRDSVITLTEGKAVEYDLNTYRIKPIPVQAVGAATLAAGGGSVFSEMFPLLLGFSVGVGTGVMDIADTDKPTVSPSVP